MSEGHDTAPEFAAVANLLALVADMRGCKARLRSLHDALAAVGEAEKRLAAKEAAFGDCERKIRGELDRRMAEVDAP